MFIKEKFYRSSIHTTDRKVNESVRLSANVEWEYQHNHEGYPRCGAVLYSVLLGDAELLEMV